MLMRRRIVRHFSGTVPLTVKLRGRTEAPDGAEGAQFLGARGAKQTTLHGPLQRLLADELVIFSMRPNPEPSGTSWPITR